MNATSTLNKPLSVLCFVCVLCLTTNAQISLPYYTGFDDDVQKNGWVQYKKAATTFSDWSFGGFGNSYSQPSSIGHDYSPSTGISLTDNWFVSPSFLIEEGGYLDSIRYRFTGFSVPEEGDTIALYQLFGSPDPELSDSLKILFDFRGDEYINDDTFRIKTAIELHASSDSSYLGLRYRNTDCSSKWLTVAFDNIAISTNSSVGLKYLETMNDAIYIYPNPTTGIFFIESPYKIDDLKLYNAYGKMIISDKSVESKHRVILSNQQSGIYFINYRIRGKSYSTKLIVI